MLARISTAIRHTLTRNVKGQLAVEDRTTAPTAGAGERGEEAPNGGAAERGARQQAGPMTLTAATVWVLSPHRTEPKCNA